MSVNRDVLERLLDCTGFQWDSGNLEKNWTAHGVRWTECEESFFNEPFLIAPDVGHSQSEPRFYALGQTDHGRRLFLVFTVRTRLVRVISARDMSRRERQEYERVRGEASETEDSGV
jgi:uncharacterized DUF497 family protein